MFREAYIFFICCLPALQTAFTHYWDTRQTSSYSSNKRPLQFDGVRVPVYKFRGEDAELECLYERNDDPLYSVQWYKDDMEFFRYMSRTRPPKKVFSLAGVRLDLNRSNVKRVVLRNLTFESTGVYSCEVSGDAPHFRTYMKMSRMVVVELPKKPPKITGARSHYRVGETARLNCTSARSHPVAQLTWTLNGVEVDERNLIFYGKWRHRDGLESTKIGLRFTVRASHFLKGPMVLKCLATVSTIYSGANEQDAQLIDEPTILEQKEQRILVRNIGRTQESTLAMIALTILFQIL